MSLDGVELELLPAWFSQLGLMGWPLAACSLITLTIGFERFVFVLKTSINSKSECRRLAETLRANRRHPKVIRDELAGILLNELHRPYFAGVKLLRMIGTISPILGLLGTILGIIAAFQVIAVQTGPVSPALIADGLWEAMLTTAVGLLIALPALIMAHFFSGFSERLLAGYCLELNRLSLSFELEKATEASEVVDFNVGARR
ncbi:MotA/TolQ/ExbB proton channel family protein [Sneathiella marina]|uniref:MotA/TolQ/ExbB proton channel family protein n=1 Tax=Sneathiella marina TaxID=2950108 RepID=A0ABY4VX72_9PROT|nr:MotA/TolQ/ExbB proton channel family protein [Sneathiella marina]USG59540.1 MotA/TolQ/ExbB proton channel family protein [Sneathiella marina]